MILFITGAGISAPSGIPTYRGQEDSLYNDKELMTLMSKESLTNNFNNLKIHLEQWKNFVQTKTYNEAHRLVTELCNKYDGYVITQNVDNFHELSGLPENHLYHIHGSLFEQRKDYNIPDVVLFGDNLKDEPSTFNIDNISTIILVGTSLTVNSVDEYLLPNIDLYVINKEKPVVKLEDYNFKSITYILDDVIEGLKQFKEVLYESNNFNRN